MAREPTPEDPMLAFKKVHTNAVQRILDRAQESSLKASGRNRPKLALNRGLLTKALEGAMAHHGRTASQRASIRKTAPDTGGRPYHFGFTTVTKGQRAPKGSRAAAKAGAPPPAAAKGSPTGRPLGTAGRTGGKAATGRHRASTREGAHQAYAERDSAVEQDNALVDPDLLAGLDGRASGAPRDRGEAMGGDVGQGARADRDVGPERDGRATDLDHDGFGADPGREPGGSQEETAETGTAARPGRRVEASQEAAERARAFEEGRGDKPAARTEGREADGAARDWVEEERRERPGLSPEATEAAAQAYVEDPRKVARVRGTTSSFGTIGNTLEERMAFWDLVHDHESSAGGRTQNRLVLELPHEASAGMRHEIVRRYVREFEDKGLPYWATIHEPTKRNDSRNYHAHVVFSDRPMAMMDHPETGERVWDFTVERVRVKPNRVKQISHPFKQKRDAGMRDRGWVKGSRARFGAIVNAVMVEHGVGVRYDPRSYKDMGLDVAPMANVSRILADKSKTRSFVVMDAEWTRRMIDAEMAEAALRRDETFQQLREIERRIQEGARNSKAAGSANKQLPESMRLAPGHRLPPWIAERLSAGLLEVERERLASKFVDEATERALSHVIEATGTERRRVAATGPNVPDPESLATLNRAAREEMAAFEAERTQRTRGFRLAGKALMNVWSDLASSRETVLTPGLSAPSPTGPGGPKRTTSMAATPPAEDGTRVLGWSGTARMRSAIAMAPGRASVAKAMASMASGCDSAWKKDPC